MILLCIKIVVVAKSKEMKIRRHLAESSKKAMAQKGLTGSFFLSTKIELYGFRHP